MGFQIGEAPTPLLRQKRFEGQAALSHPMGEGGS